MSTPSLPLALQRIGVVGAGAMGRGIAQLLAQSGREVWLCDDKPAVAEAALREVAADWDKLRTKGRMAQADLDAACARLHLAPGLDALAGCDLVVEAIVERLDAKQALLRRLETLVSPACILASNTSSLSIAALASACQHPQRVAGLHFFNPVTRMKVVEVVAAVRTDAAVADALAALVASTGHTAVRTVDSPGFIVNHAGRGFVTEALAIAQEGVADFRTIDTILRQQAGFRLGPFELMDLTGLDVSHPVMEAIHAQFYGEARFRPSAITAQRLAAGLLGRKSAAGFYGYGADGRVIDAASGAPAAETAQVPIPAIWIAPQSHCAAELAALLGQLGADIDDGAAPAAASIVVTAPLGLDASAALQGLPGLAERSIAIDLLLPDAGTGCRVLMATPATSAATLTAARAVFSADGKPVHAIRDSAGFVAQRVLAMIVNIGCEICQQGIATPADLDAAVQLGLGYPMGPIAWGQHIGPTRVLAVLRNLLSLTGDPRYRPSAWLRRRAELGLPLSATQPAT